MSTTRLVNSRRPLSPPRPDRNRSDGTTPDLDSERRAQVCVPDDASSPATGSASNASVLACSAVAIVAMCSTAERASAGLGEPPHHGVAQLLDGRGAGEPVRGAIHAAREAGLGIGTRLEQVDAIDLNRRGTEETESNGLVVGGDEPMLDSKVAELRSESPKVLIGVLPARAVIEIQQFDLHIEAPYLRRR